MEFVVEVDRLKTVMRRSPLIAANRLENDAEHSWHLALMVCVLAEYSDQPIDVGRTLQLVIVHDLVEIYAGDTFVYDNEGAKGQVARERDAAGRLFALLPDDQADTFHGLWEEFEAHATPEARFAKAMDRLQPTLMNFNTGGGTWHTPGVTSDDVVLRKSVIQDASHVLWHYAKRLIGLGVARGWLAAATDSAPGELAGGDRNDD
ncbi:HD domain-containing protein [Micromonospora sp. NPDC005324]|uniref:HD domain-containing protein n=1 Tax=Micromonospora sp. NPDC005324 TaxID=3157033 RepID=UPI0033BC96B1